MRFALSSALAFLIFGAPCADALENEHGKEITVQTLYEHCKSPKDIEQLLCMTYLSGVSAIMTVAGAMAIDADATPEKRAALRVLGICNHEFITLGQMQQIFINWAERNPKDWQQEQSIGAWAAFVEAWPCPQ